MYWSLFLTNRLGSFQNTVIIETGTSDFHKMVIEVLKFFYKKQKTKVIQYRSNKNFDNQLFQRDLNSSLLKIDLNNADLSEFTKIFLPILDEHAPKNKSLYDKITLIL